MKIVNTIFTIFFGGFMIWFLAKMPNGINENRNKNFIVDLKPFQINKLVTATNYEKRDKIVIMDSIEIYNQLLVAHLQDIKVGDSVVHNKNSDTVYVYRKDSLVSTRIFPLPSLDECEYPLLYNCEKVQSTTK